jgi:hypothetical protein
MSNATEAMNLLSGSVLTFAFWVVVSYGAIILLVNTLPVISDCSRQTKSGLVRVLSVTVFGLIGYAFFINP